MLAHKSWKYFLVFILCFGAYIATKHYFKTVLVEKKISYTTTASEVFMVWGLTSGWRTENNSPPDLHYRQKLISTIGWFKQKIKMAMQQIYGIAVVMIKSHTSLRSIITGILSPATLYFLLALCLY